MRTIACALLVLSSSLFAETVYYYGFDGAPVELTRIDTGDTAWPVVSYGARPMPLTGRIGVKREGGEKVEFIDLEAGVEPFAAARRLAGEPGVRWAQPEWLVPVRLQGTTNDPYLEKEWHLAQAGVLTAWDTTKGFAHTRVAVIDSGADYAHDDLFGNLEPGIDLTGGDHAWCDRPPTVSNSQLIAAHGTCVAGIIGAVGDNGRGLAGVCPFCAVLPVKMLRYDETLIPVSRIYEAIVAAVDAGADVINNSWGEEDTDAMGKCVAVPRDNYRAEAIRYAKEKGRNGRGTLVVWAAGNSQCDTGLNENLKNPDILVVAALDQAGGKAWYGNYGAEVTVSAGAANWTTDITGADGLNDKLYITPQDALDYTDQFSGTSASAAVLSGIAALMYAANPLLDFTQAMRCIRQSAVKPPTTTCAAGDFADPVGDLYAPPGMQRSPCFGYGIPDAATLVTIARDGTCGESYGGCATDAQCGAGFQCDTMINECLKKIAPQKDGGCSLTLVD